MSTTAPSALIGKTVSRLPYLLPLLGVARVATLVVWPAFAHAIEVWSLGSEFSYGFFVLPASLLLIWWRREALRLSIGRGALGGLLIVAGALALYLLAHRLDVNALAGLAVIPLLWGIVVYLWGWGAGRVLAFPIGF